MRQTTIPIKPDARVLIRCSDNLSVEGNISSVLSVITERGDCVRMKDENGLYQITANADCLILLPESVLVTVEKVGGDCFLNNLKNRVIIGKIGGNLKMETIAGATAESIGDGCWIHQASRSDRVGKNWKKSYRRPG